MQDEITINIRALTKKQRDIIERIIDTQLNFIPDDTLEGALEVLQNFTE